MRKQYGVTRIFRFGSSRRFIAISLGSLAELETQSLVCEDLKFLEHDDDLYRQIRGIRLMLTSLQNSLRTRALSL
jgi:four helix bundle protein